MPRTARKYGRQYSSLFSNKSSKGPKQVFSTPTEGQLKLINKAKKHSILF